jgi:hypothetical protein
MDVFNIHYYREMNPDIGRNRDVKLIKIFNENKNTDRIYNNYTFMKKYPYFDLEYFRNFNESLFSESSLLLKTKFHSDIANINSYIYNKESFLKKYPDFNIDIYKENNKNIIENIDILDEFTIHLFYHREINNLSNKYTFYEKYNKIMEYRNDTKKLFYNIINNSLVDNSLTDNLFCENLSNYTVNTTNLIENKVINVSDYNFDFVYPNKNNENNSLYELFSNYKKYYDDNKIFKLSNFYNLLNHENYFYWIESCIKNKCVSIISPKTGKIISSDTYFIILYEHNSDKYLNSIVNYYFEEEDIVLGLGLGTGTILSSMETRILYIYNHHELVLHYSYENMYIETFNQKLFPLIIKNIVKINFEKETINKYKSQVITLYGYHTNLGHNLFNDMTGLFILDQAKTFNNIDKVILGNNDPFFIHKYLNQYNNLEIEETEYITHYNNYIGKGIFFKYNHYHISNKCCNFIKTILKNEFLIKYNEVIDDIEVIDDKKIVDSKLVEEVKIKKIDLIQKEIEKIKNNNSPIISIVLRKGHTFIENQVDFFIELIDKICELYPNAFFYFDGFCSNPYLKDNTPIIHSPKEITYKDFIIEYNELYNEITQKIDIMNLEKNRTTKYKSLINMYSYEIVEYLSICNYGIYQMGSACTISGWLCNIPGYQFGRTNTHLYKYCDDNVKENMPNLVYTSDKKININNIIEDIKKLFG